MISDLMQTVVDATKPVATQGTVERRLLMAPRSALDAIYAGSPDVFTEMSRRITNARREVLLQTFRWQDASVPAAILRDSLKALAARKPSPPVDVQIVLRQGWRDRLGRRETRLLRALVKTFDPRYVRVEVRAYPQWLVGSLHAKSLIVDGRRAVMTGCNPELSSDPPNPQFDTGYLLHGDIVHTLRADLLDARRRTKLLAGNLPLGTRYKPLPSAAFCKAGRPRRDDMPILFASRQAAEMLRQRSLDNPQAQAFLAAINNAQRRICIMTPNLNARPVRHALEAAAKRGVQVHVVLSHGFNNLTERWLQGGGNHEVARRLRHYLERHGAEGAAERLQIRWFGDLKGVLVHGNSPGASHAKGAVFDDHLLAVGSANMDTQSWFHSREINLFIDSELAARQWLDRVFEPRFRAGAKA